MSPIQQMLLGVGVGATKTYVDDVFSQYAYIGNGSGQTITNDINVSGEGALVWIKKRSGGSAQKHILSDTVRGLASAGNAYYLSSDSNEAQDAGALLTAFNNNGFNVSSNDIVNGSGSDYTSWTFRKAPGFFTVKEFTGSGSNQYISHDLGSVPGLIIIKSTSASGNWIVFHRSLGKNKYLRLSTGEANSDNGDYWGNFLPTATKFRVGVDGEVNSNNVEYIAYIFAHNNGDGEFGESGDKDIIKCGSYTGTGSANNVVTLGFEPQYVMLKNSTAGDGWSNWFTYDNMRGVPTGDDDNHVLANKSNAESSYSGNSIDFTSTGFTVQHTGVAHNQSGSTFVYIAIRRLDGSVGKPVKDATKVFAMDTGSESDTIPNFDSGFPVDFAFYKRTAANGDWSTGARLIQGRELWLNENAAEDARATHVFDGNTGWDNSTKDSGFHSWMWKRHAGFDVVCYTGNSTNPRTINHSLGQAPHMIWTKGRNIAEDWTVGHHEMASSNPWNSYMDLNSDSAASATTLYVGTPGATSYQVGSHDRVNGAYDYIAFLFSSVDGISKCGEYDGDSGGITVTTGFQPRFLFIKVTTTANSWYTLDTTRGWGSGDDKFMYFDSNQPQSDHEFGAPTSTGFTLPGGNNGICNSGHKYIYYAHA